MPFDPTRPSVPYVTFEGLSGRAPVSTSLPDDPQYVPLILNGVEIPRVRAAQLLAIPKAEYNQWLADREACLRDQLVLSKVMGLDLVENPHRAMFDFLGRVTPGMT